MHGRQLAGLMGMCMAVACGKKGESIQTTDTASVSVPSGSTAASESAAASSGGGAIAAPVTGAYHVVKMVGDAKGYRFVPDKLTISAGDGVQFVGVSGNPHNVEFDSAGIPAGSEAQLVANMSKTVAKLRSAPLVSDKDTFTVSFARLPAGDYHIVCPIHVTYNMKGVITVK